MPPVLRNDALFESFRLDYVNQCLWRGDVRVEVKPKPFAVLAYLVTHAGRLVTQDELLAAVWPDTFVQPEVLRQYILEIRRALGDDADRPRFIRTFPKRGYEFIARVSDVVANADATASAAPLVGRADALADLDEYLARAAAGRRQVVFVSGEAGIGKSALMDAFLSRAAVNPGVRLARGHSLEGFGGKEAYYPVFEALGQLARGAAAPIVLGALAKQAPTWMIQFPSLVPPEQRSALQRDLLGATRERMVRELCEALEVITEATTVVLVLEDLHWADHSTLDVISAIARRRQSARLLVAGTFRPADVIVSGSPLKGLRHDLVLHRLASELMLERLREPEVAEYLDRQFAGSDLPEGLATLIHRHSDGNPLFMTAMLDHLIREGVLSDRDGRWTLMVPLNEVDPGVPETLGQMLEIQLQYVSDDERRLLACASVAGQHFTAWAVAVMLSRAVADVEAQCAALAEHQQFLKANGTQTLPDGTLTPAFSFRHALYREVLYRRLNRSERVDFHRRLTDALERFSSPRQLAAELALHCEEGGEHERAVGYLVLAAQNASHRYAHREAIDVLEQARTLLPRIPAASAGQLGVQLLGRMGDAYYALGDMDGSAASYDHAAMDAARAGLIALQADALLSLARPTALVDPDRCIAACERVAQIGKTTGHVEVEARAEFLASCWRVLIKGWTMPDVERCVAAAGRLQELGRLHPYDQILYASFQRFQSRYDEAIRNAEDSLQRLKEPAGLWEHAGALSVKAFALAMSGRLGEAHRTLDTGLELATKNGNAQWVNILRTNLALLYWIADDAEGIRALSDDMLQSTESNPAMNAWRKRMLVFRGLGELAAGEYSSARRSFEDGGCRPTDRGLLLWYWRMYSDLGASETSLAVGDLTRAKTEADSLLEAASGCEESFVKALTWTLRARLALASGNRTGAEEDVGRGLEIVEAIDVPPAAWQVHATAYDVYQSTHPRKAAAHQSRARAFIDALANSLDQDDRLRRSFLANPRVQRVVRPKRA